MKRNFLLTFFNMFKIKENYEVAHELSSGLSPEIRSKNKQALDTFPLKYSVDSLKGSIDRYGEYGNNGWVRKATLSFVERFGGSRYETQGDISPFLGRFIFNVQPDKPSRLIPRISSNFYSGKSENSDKNLDDVTSLSNADHIAAFLGYLEEAIQGYKKVELSEILDHWVKQEAIFEQNFEWKERDQLGKFFSGLDPARISEAKRRMCFDLKPLGELFLDAYIAGSRDDAEKQVRLKKRGEIEMDLTKFFIEIDEMSKRTREVLLGVQGVVHDDLMGIINKQNK